jgi:hypothetical protein
VIVGAGRTAAAATHTASILRNQSDIFDMGGQIVRVDGNTVLPLDRHSLSHLLGILVRYVKIREDKVTSDDPPQRMVDMLLSPGFPRSLRSLNAVITAPTIRPDGSVIDTPGYDTPTGLLYAPAGAAPPVPMNPSAAELHQAINDLFQPFRLFPFVSPLDWSIMAAAMLTAVIRPALPTSPAFAFDAPTQGSGKTLLAKSAAMQASGEIPKVLPHVERRDDEEMRKRLFSALRGSQRVIFLDNVTGVFDSPSLAALLTAARFEDRVLGRSETLALPNRSLVLLFGQQHDAGRRHAAADPDDANRPALRAALRPAIRLRPARVYLTEPPADRRGCADHRAGVAVIRCAACPRPRCEL